MIYIFNISLLKIHHETINQFIKKTLAYVIIITIFAFHHLLNDTCPIISTTVAAHSTNVLVLSFRF